MNETLRLIHERRSVRTFQKKTIDRQTAETIIDAAIRSPTAGNMMLYSIIEIADQDLKDELVLSCDNQPFIAKAPLVLLFVADYQRWFDYFLSSDVESYCQDRDVPFRLPAEGDLMLACCDALIAAQTAVLAAESLGIGSCYIGDIMENYEKHQELLNLPRYTFPITMLCFGYPSKAASARQLTPRLSRGSVLHRNSYSRTDSPALMEMFAAKKPGSFMADTKNTGQHFYAKKFGAAFSIEMTRSVRAAIKSWTGKD